MAGNRLDEGDSYNPKGIPQLTCMAPLLDPRMKSGIGMPSMDKGHIPIKDEDVQIAMDDFGNYEMLEQQQQKYPENQSGCKC